MTAERLALAELLEKAGDGDFLRAVAEAVLQLLMETDVESLIGVARHERSPDRLNYRNGYRDRTLDTRLGTLALRVPKLRQGSYFPPFLEPRRMTEKALVAVIHRAQRARSIPAGTMATRPSRGGLDRRCLHSAGRRLGASDGPLGHLQVAGLQALQVRIPTMSAGWRIALWTGLMSPWWRAEGQAGTGCATFLRKDSPLSCRR